MLEDEVKQISLGALKQLDLDLIQCERMRFCFSCVQPFSVNLCIRLIITTYYESIAEFAQSEPVKGLDAALLLECFADVRQLLDLFNQCDFSAYFHDFGERTSKYPRVTPQSAIKLLEK